MMNEVMMGNKGQKQKVAIDDRMQKDDEIPGDNNDSPPIPQPPASCRWQASALGIGYDTSNII